MAGSLNYLVPTDSMTLTDQKEFRRKAISLLVELAVSKTVANRLDLDAVNAGNAPETVDIRDFQNILDAGTALDQWNTAALAVVGTNYSVFQAIAAPVLANNRVVVFYKVSVETVPLPVSRLIFRSGGALGNIRAIFDLESLADQLRAEAYFSEAVLYGPTDIFPIQVMCRIVTGVARVKLGALVCEPKGQTVA